MGPYACPPWQYCMAPTLWYCMVPMHTTHAQHRQHTQSHKTTYTHNTHNTCACTARVPSLAVSTRQSACLRGQHFLVQQRHGAGRHGRRLERGVLLLLIGQPSAVCVVRVRGACVWRVKLIGLLSLISSRICPVLGVCWVYVGCVGCAPIDPIRSMVYVSTGHGMSALYGVMVWYVLDQ